MFKSSKKALLGALLVLPSLLLAMTANAADLRIDNSGRDQSVFRVASTDSVKNLYAVGGQVVVDANSSKDSSVVGGSVEVNGNTADDLIVIGGHVTITGSVGGSARIVGGTTNVEGKIAEDLVIVGGTVYISPKSEIAGDLVILGGNVVLDAPVKGSIKATTGTLEINNSVNGSVDARVGQLVLAPGADIKGDLNYTSQSLVRKDANAKVEGTTNFVQAQNHRAAFHALVTVGFFVKLVAMILASYLIFYIMRKRFSSITNRVAGKFWKNIVIGFVGLIAFPIAAIILMATLVGFYLGLILMAVYFLALLLSMLVASAAVGTWLLARVNEKVFRVRYRSIALGIIVVSVLQIIPLIGGLIMLVLLLSGLGAVLSFLWDSRKLSIE